MTSARSSAALAEVHAWYGREGRIVGVLTHEADEQYERGCGSSPKEPDGPRCGRRGPRT